MSKGGDFLSCSYAHQMTGCFHNLLLTKQDARTQQAGTACLTVELSAALCVCMCVGGVYWDLSENTLYLLSWSLVKGQSQWDWDIVSLCHTPPSPTHTHTHCLTVVDNSESDTEKKAITQPPMTYILESVGVKCLTQKLNGMGHIPLKHNGAYSMKRS